MPAVFEIDQMARKANPPPPPDPSRVTVINVKGSDEERAFMQEMSRDTGVSISEIVRRGVAMWAASRGFSPPADWKGK